MRRLLHTLPNNNYLKRLSTLKKLIVKDVQVGAAPAEYAEHWKAPAIVESTLKYTAVIFRKTFNSPETTERGDP